MTWEGGRSLIQRMVGYDPRSSVSQEWMVGYDPRLPACQDQIMMVGYMNQGRVMVG